MSIALILGGTGVAVAGFSNIQGGVITRFAITTQDTPTFHTGTAFATIGQTAWAIAV